MEALKSPSLKDKAVAALWGLFIGDALAMPAHWFVLFYGFHFCNNDVLYFEQHKRKGRRKRGVNSF